MPIRGLFATLLFVLCSIALTCAQTAPSLTGAAIAQNPSLLNLAPPSAPVRDLNRAAFNVPNPRPRMTCRHDGACVREWTDANGDKHMVTYDMRDPNATCYTMRAYYFERVPSNPDALRK